MNREILRTVASASRMSCRDTASANEAVELLARGEPFDVAILDSQMPGTSGTQLARTLRSSVQTRGLPLLLLTSALSPSDQADRELFDVLLTKPIRQSTLLDTLASVLVGRPGTTRRGRAIAGLDAGLAARIPRRILVVDDNVMNQKVAVRMLESCGYRPDAAANGLEAVSALRRQPYDLVFMDLQMPDMDGLDATRQIRAELAPERQPHIVGLTAAAFDEDRQACLIAGMDDQITKPFRPEVLMKAVLESLRDRKAPEPQPVP